MRERILVLNGPNLNLLGQREPAIYGPSTLEHLMGQARERAAALGADLADEQTNSEGVLVELLQQAPTRADGVVLNAGALTHSSWAIADAIAAVRVPVVEVHLSNPAAREPFRHRSTIARVVAGSIAGFGSLSYELAVVALVEILRRERSGHP
jgi:3-dehydroquinate dehydratase-2